jgi:hypothetical protein
MRKTPEYPGWDGNGYSTEVTFIRRIDRLTITIKPLSGGVVVKAGEEKHFPAGDVPRDAARLLNWFPALSPPQQEALKETWERFLKIYKEE